MTAATADKVIATVTLTTKMDDGHTLNATAQLHQLAGNQRPYFSVTAEEIDNRRRHNPDLGVIAGGQMTDKVLHYFPQLAPLVALHLADDRGQPMHAVENGAYWLGLGDPRYVPENAPRFDHFARLWRVSDERARELYDYANADNHPTEALHFLAKGEAERWQREADEGLALIRSLAEASV